MLQVKTLTARDYDFAVDLANTMKWNMAAEDFEFNASLEPAGCLLLMDGKERLGIATCISYGKVGWFGNLVVKEDSRKRGGGSTLVKHAINYLHGKGVETVGLYAYPHLHAFYGRLGFKLDQEYSVLSAENLVSPKVETLPKVGKEQFPAIARFDSAYFGAERTKLLESIILQEGNASYYVSEGKDVIGYIAATIYESMAWVGPLICPPNRQDVAASLVKSILSQVGGRNVYAVVSKANLALQSLLAKFGFSEEFYVSRMYLGPSKAKNCIYLAESLERG
jgi:GNAT superfamily N-acetyltransferase